MLAPAARADCALGLLVPCIQVTMPASPLSLGTVGAGTTTISAEQLINISSSSDFGVKVSSDLVDGRMKEWTGAAYAASPKILTTPLDVAKTSYNGATNAPAWQALTSTPSLFGTGSGQGFGPTDCLTVIVTYVCGSRNLGVKYRLRTSFADRRVNPNSYRILVTYTADHAF